MTDANRDIDPATARVLASIDDPALASRYPDRAHFISTDSPKQSEMATRALFAGDPVVFVYPDGRELLITPDHAHRVAALLIAVGALLARLLKRGNEGRAAMQLPPGARIEARDSTGMPIAA
jgi:hypothetical protein